jgi:HK97 family phage portal protein
VSLLHRVLGVPERREVQFDRDLSDWLGGTVTSSGVSVDRESAMRVSAVFGSVRILSETISTLPAGAYIREGGARKPVRARPRWLDSPNPAMRLGRIDVLSQVMTSLLLDGNAYLATARRPTGEVVSITVLDPAKVTPEDVKINGRTRRLYRAEGQLWEPFDILHIPGMMLPGATEGLSPVGYAKETIGLALAAQEFGARFFGNGALPGALVEVPTSMSDQGVRQLKAAWRETHGGVSNSHKLGVLTEGAKFAKITLDPDDAQFLETRQFQVPDIARVFGVPPHLLADASNSTSWGSGLAEQNLAFAQHSLRPWVERIEQGLTWLLVSEGVNVRAFVKLDLNGLMRGSLAERMAAYSTGLQQGIYNLDEVRALEDLAPIPNGKGKSHRVPLNLGPVGETPPAATRDILAALERALRAVPPSDTPEEPPHA